MEPVDVPAPMHDGAISKPTVEGVDDVPLHHGKPASSAAAKANGAKRGVAESDEDKKPAKKQKKAFPPPIKKRKTAVLSSDDEDDNAEGGGDEDADMADAHQTLSIAVKVDKTLPDPELPAPDAKLLASNGTTTKPPSSKSKKAKPAADSSDLSEEDIPLSQKSASQQSKKNGTSASTSSAKPPSSKREKKPRSSSSKKQAIVDSSDDEPIPARKGKRAPAVKKEEASDEDDDNAPLQKALPGIKKKTATAAAAQKSKKKAAVQKEESDASSEEAEASDFSDEDEKPIASKRKATSSSAKSTPAKKAATAKAKAKKEESGDEEMTPAAEKKKAGKRKTAKEEEEEEKFRWWENEDQDNSDKWTTLEHNGVLFPPPYERLPKHVKMKYEGKSVTLPEETEEIATFIAKTIDTDHFKDEIFRANLFRDWQHWLKVYPPEGGLQITDLNKCDFRPMADYFDAEKEVNKKKTAAEKKEAKRIRDEMEAPYATCLLDGRKEKVGNFRAEPPSLFRGRGEHPKKGTLKVRLRPEDITLNLGKDAPIPVPNIPGKWAGIQHDNTVTWLATWKENVNNQVKYVFLAPSSSLKGQSDMAKFEKARTLKLHIDRIRKDYEEGLRSKVTADRQRATAMYFIDKLALRAGNEKGEDEADTVGCCSLRYEHVILLPPSTLRFDFLGKDSIRYVNEIEVDEQVFKNVKLFKREPKVHGDLLFDRLNTGILNKHLSSYMKGLSAKVFRTYNASITMEQELLKNTPKKGTVAEKVLAYNRANRLVAVLCNHQKAVGKGHAGSMEKLGDKVFALKYQRMKLRHIAYHHDPKLKRKGDLADELESDLEENWIESHEEELKLKEIEKAKKKFEKNNEKLKENGEPEESEKILKQTIKDIEEEYKAIKKATKKGINEPKGKAFDSVVKVRAAIEKLDERIQVAKTNVVDRAEGAEVSLGTSKMNYIDPRVTIAWAKEHDVPAEKLLSKVLLDKFAWAIDTDGDWRF